MGNWKSVRNGSSLSMQTPKQGFPPCPPYVAAPPVLTLEITRMLLLTAQATVPVLSIHSYWVVKNGDQAKLLGEEGDILQARDEVQGWEGALSLFKAMGGSSHVAMSSFFCPDLPRFSDKRAQETSKCCWQSCSSSWEHALHREHLAWPGARTAQAQLSVDQRPSPGTSTSLRP